MRRRFALIVPPKLWARDHAAIPDEVHEVTPLIHVAKNLQDRFESWRWRFAFIGGLALQRWGNPRLTVDVDVSLFTGFGEETAYVDRLLGIYQSRITDAREFALARRVLLLTDGNVGIDVALAALPFEKAIIERSSFFEYLPGICLRTCSAEDLIVLKAFADRLQDWADIESVLARQHGWLDLDLIRRQLMPLVELKEAPEIMTRFERMAAAGK